MVDADVNITAEYLPNPEVSYYEQMAPEFINSPGIIKFTDKGVIRIDSTNLDKGTVTVQSIPAKEKMFMGHVGEVLDKNYENVTPSRISNIVGKMYTMAQMYPRIKENMNFFENTEEGRIQEFNELRQKFGEVRSGKMLHRVENIMNQLQKGIATVDNTAYDKPYSFFIANRDEINALCAANRVMVVNKGTLNDISDDDELAAVLAHEMGHGQMEHSSAMLSKHALSNLGIYMLQGNVDGFVMDTLAKQVNSIGIDKVKEREADDLSFHYLVASGYNPGAPAAFWQRRMDRPFTNIIVNGVDSFNRVYNPDTHPEDKERLNNFSKKLTDYSNGHVTVFRGSVKIDGEEVVCPGHTYEGNKLTKSDWERSYLVAGNLATICRNGIDKDFYVENNKVMYDGKEIFSCEQNDRPAEEIVSKLNRVRESVLSNDNTNYNAVSLAKNGSYLQFDSRGNLVKRNALDTEKVNASREKFLENLLQASDTLNSMNHATLSDFDKGKQAGACLVKVLEDKSAVEFFDSIRQQAKKNVEPLSKGVNVYYDSLKRGNNSFNDSIHLTLDSHSNSLMRNLHLKGEKTTRNHIYNVNIDSLTDYYLYDNDKYFGLVGEFSKMQHNTDFNRGIMEAFKDNPKAMENLNAIFKIENDMVNDIESLRFNVYGKKVQNSAEMTKKLKKMVKEYSKEKAELDAYFSRKTSTSFDDRDSKVVDKLEDKCTDIRSYIHFISNEIYESKLNHENFSASYPNFNPDHSAKSFDKQEKELNKIKKDFEGKAIEATDYILEKMDEIDARNKNVKSNEGKAFVKGIKVSEEKSTSLPKFEFQNPKKKILSLGKDNKVLEREVEVKKPNLIGNRRGSYEKNDNGR